jgi:hypothetical protein
MIWAPMWVENSNVVVTIVGDPGDGKSYASLRLGEVIDPDFGLDQVASGIAEFMHLVNDDSYSQGQPIVLEEGSIEASAYDWHSVSNKVFRQVLDIWRNENRMAIINLPNFQALEKGARRRTDLIIEMLEAKPWKNYSKAKVKKAKYNNISDNFTTPFPILDGMERKWMKFKPPSDELLHDYENQKEEYNQERYEELIHELLDDDEDDKDDELGPKEIATEIQNNEGVETYIKDNNGMKYIDRDLIELEYEIGDGTSKKVKKVLVERLNLDVM